MKKETILKLLDPKIKSIMVFQNKDKEAIKYKQLSNINIRDHVFTILLPLDSYEDKNLNQALICEIKEFESETNNLKIITDKNIKDFVISEYQKENKGKKYQVGRMKGLGEMDVEETEETLTDPNNRIIKQISVEDVAAADKLFNDLMGNAVIPRKRYIKEHSQEATYNAE